MKVFLKLKFIGIVIFFWISIYGKAQQTPSQLADSLQAILNNSLPTNFSNSGAIMSITVPGLWSWSGSTGYSIAGITSGQNQMLASSSNQFRVGSITKMMLATCILKLQEMGQLSIEDPISLYLRSTLVNDTIQSSGIVKIRHLLNHTSGIANSADNTTCQMDVLNNPTAGHTLEDAIFCGASQGEVFPPEFAWAYSNTNYSILAMIINHVSGMDYRDFVQQTIFSPLNMSQTFIPTANVISDSHMGCYWNMGSWIDLTIINPTTYAGWADVVSTTNDLILYYAALRNGQIINAASFQLMQTMFPGTYDYGLGYDHYLFSGVNYDGHYGEVANTSGLFFANTNSQIAPNGYYIAYNFNTQGADMIQKIDLPVFNLLNGSINTSGIETVNTPLKVEVFPNPVTTEVTISNLNNELDNVFLFDGVGNLVCTLSNLKDKKILKIDCSHYKRGVYFLKLESNHSVDTRKLVLN